MKPPEVEALYQSYSKLCSIWLKRRKFETPIKKENMDTGVTDSLGATSDDILDACEDLIGEQMVFDESDRLLCKHLKATNFRGTVDRWLKSYITSGRELNTLIALFKLSGAVDGVLIEQKELMVAQILSKVQSSKYSPVNDTLDNIQKQMTVAMLINAYMTQVTERIGLYFLMDNMKDPQVDNL